MRYPVDIRTASEIDDRVTRAVADLMDRGTQLKSATIGLPKIRAAIKGLRVPALSGCEAVEWNRL